MSQQLPEQSERHPMSRDAQDRLAGVRDVRTVGEELERLRAIEAAAIETVGHQQPKGYTNPLWESIARLRVALGGSRS